MTLIIVTGMREELEVFRNANSHAYGTQTNKGVTLLSTRLGLHTAWVAHAGCGKVAATVAAHAAIREADTYSGTYLISCGTAGYLYPGSDPASVHLITEATQHDYGEWTEGSFKTYTPGSLPIGGNAAESYITPLDLLKLITPVLKQPLDGLCPKISTIASGDCFVNSQAHADAIIKSTGASLVDMEAAALAQVAAYYGMPWFAVKSTTDNADSASEEHFQRNLLRASIRSRDLITRIAHLI